MQLEKKLLLDIIRYSLLFLDIAILLQIKDIIRYD